MHVNIHHLLQQYGYHGIFFAFLFEMIGIPFPGETILTISGIEWKKGAFSLVPLVLSAWAGNVIGSNISYFIGRFLGRTVLLRFGRIVGITEKKLNAADKKFNRYQSLVVLLGKFIAGVRVLAAYLAGINRMDFLKFSLYNAAGSFIWIIVFIVLGRYIEIAWQHYHQFLYQSLGVIVGVLLAALIAVIFKKRFQRTT